MGTEKGQAMIDDLVLDGLPPLFALVIAGFVLWRSGRMGPIANTTHAVGAGVGDIDSIGYECEWTVISHPTACAATRTCRGRGV